MDTPHTNEERDVMAAIATIEEQVAAADLTLDELIDFERITYLTGIQESVVRRLFSREDVAPEELDLSFTERLRFLHETRRAPNKDKYTITAIAEGTGVSKESVSKMLSGARRAGLDVGADLERFFKVAPGFFTNSGSEALLAALESVIEGLNYILMAKAKGVRHLALRGGLVEGDDRMARQLRLAMQRALEAEDPEMQKITETVRALPEARRRSVVDIMKSVLGLAGEGSNHHKASPSDR
ncbi:XRE family transcriptional regulator [Streptomyces chartreusis]|uniref:XRE family transcriptional regulator n=1 Tax=Streptomyces chartreusis TaxID=1969 RepID=UPI003866E6DF|nr:XRE family transcriptional regulator [Streptomyces chartreusis]